MRGWFRAGMTVRHAAHARYALLFRRRIAGIDHVGGFHHAAALIVADVRPSIEFRLLRRAYGSRFDSPASARQRGVGAHKRLDGADSSTSLRLGPSLAQHSDFAASQRPAARVCPARGLLESEVRSATHWRRARFRIVRLEFDQIRATCRPEHVSVIVGVEHAFLGVMPAVLRIPRSRANSASATLRAR